GGFGVNLVLEFLSRELHEFMGISRVAIFASELAAAIGIDGPLKRHLRLDAIEDRPRRNFEILNRPLGFKKVALSGEASDANQGHNPFSLFIRHMASGRVDRSLTVDAKEPRP